MTTMKAVRLFEFGGPDKLVYGDHPLPEVGPGDVLVKVLATSVSRWDVKYRTGEVHEFYGKATGHHGGIQGRRAFPMPMQLGRDVGGEVAAVGDRGARSQGRRPRRRPGASGKSALARRHARARQSVDRRRSARPHHVRRLCAVRRAAGETTGSRCRRSSISIRRRPSMWACATAHHVLAARLNARLNDTVLVTGAAGGMGTATMRLAKLAGCTVIATTRYPRKAEALKRCGADLVVDTGRADALADDPRFHRRRRRRRRGRIYRRHRPDAAVHRQHAARRHLLPGRRRDEGECRCG